MKLRLSSVVKNKYDRETVKLLFENYNFMRAVNEIHMKTGDNGYIIVHYKTNMILSYWSFKESKVKMKNEKLSREEKESKVKMRNIKLSQKDVEFVNEALMCTPVSYNSANEITSLSKKDLLFIVDYLAMRIGYDETTDDISSEGYEADTIIGKLMTLVYFKEEP